MMLNLFLNMTFSTVTLSLTSNVLSVTDLYPAAAKPAIRTQTITQTETNRNSRLNSFTFN
jgi:hypothetical protein